MIRGALRPLIRGGLRSVIPGVSDEFQALIDSLFGSGEQGLLFVPEPGFKGKDTLYQLDNGTTLTDASGDPVGLGLEWSKGLELGPEELGNTSFDTADFYNVLSGASISGGQLFIADQSSSRAEGLGNFIPAGVTVEVTIDVEPGSGTVSVVLADSGGVVNIVALSGVSGGVHKARVYTEGTNGNFRIIRSAGSSIVNSISVKELPGNHLTQSVSADRPLYQTDGSKHWLEHDQAGDNLVASLPDLGTNATLAYANAAGVTILEGQTISGDTIIPQEVELYGVIYLDRPFTASETSKVTDYFNKLRGAS